jgi:hypothetical protein
MFKIRLIIANILANITKNTLKSWLYVVLILSRTVNEKVVEVKRLLIEFELHFVEPILSRAKFIFLNKLDIMLKIDVVHLWINT